MNQHSPEYKKVLRSARWRKLRNERLWSAGWRCEKCGTAGTEKTLTLHHLTYDRLGNERPEDLALLCSKCHWDEDKERAERTRVRQSLRRWGARVDGWASKRYGNDWDSFMDWHVVEEEFERWLEQREERW